MRHPFLNCLLIASGLGALLSNHRLVSAQSQGPVAVVQQPGRRVTVHSFSGLGISVGPGGERPGESNPWLPYVPIGEEYNHLLVRAANQAEPVWKAYDAALAETPHAVRVQGTQGRVIVSMSGCKILFASWDSSLVDDPLLKNTDLLVLWSEQTTEWNEAVAALNDCDLPLILSVDKPAGAGDRPEMESFNHNTIALSAGRKLEGEQPRWVLLSENAWSMPDDLAQAFEKMERACEQSRQVFQKLSVEQMSFQPGNGTHTPRWNAEHMMGRQLLFFSQIYNAVDPAIPVLNWNPKQNPEDYEPANPDWDGAEEARRMRDVQQFTRRFAYLLEGMPLDRRAKGSRWPTLAALLAQMERHYAEHTENTRKKFELPDWPEN